MQQLVEHPSTSADLRPSLFSAMLSLSKNSDLCPRCLTIQNVNKLREYPFDAGGGFGEVWKGTIGNPELSQLVCLKIMKIYRDSDIEQLSKEYRREAIPWRQLKHPNVLPFLGIYKLEHDRQLCLISPWMKKGNLVQFLRNTPREDVDHYTLAHDVAAGLSYLHKKKIIHGDLKGVNILMTDSLRACLGDFGLSRVVDTLGRLRITSTTRSRGTGRWLAPELLLEDGATSKASDIYAYGCVCYEIFTGRHPFPELPNETAVTLAVNQGKQPSRPVEAKKLTDLMWALMEKCWAATPSSRPDAGRVVDEIVEMNLRNTRTYIESAPDWDESLFTQVWANVEYCSLVQLPKVETELRPAMAMRASTSRSLYCDPPPPYSSPIDRAVRTERTIHASYTQPSRPRPLAEGENDISCDDIRLSSPYPPPLANDARPQPGSGSTPTVISAHPRMRIAQPSGSVYPIKEGHVMVTRMSYPHPLRHHHEVEGDNVASHVPSSGTVRRRPEGDAEIRGNGGCLSKRIGGQAHKENDLPTQSWQFVKKQGELTRSIGSLITTALEDTTLMLDVCKQASASDPDAKEAARALRRGLKCEHQLSAVRLWAIMLEKCSGTFITGRLTSKKFLRALEDLGNSCTDPVVKERVLDVLWWWASAVPNNNYRL
ncbi:Rho guanine nucleotide exchange factor [Marasmius crinis-equi]|uniref:Rho guanine nucleotide exchange factor n=1 Tax=Marasmius crinis-equi TaxID=585013 RepID=A0ABR3FTL2_9AGAR